MSFIYFKLYFLSNYFVVSQILCTFGAMKAKVENQSAILSQEEVFREKADHYLVCFIDKCPLREQCLRWLVGQYTDTTLLACNAINPRNPKMGGEQCEMFRKNQLVLMKRGMTRLYLDMPGRVEYQIRRLLIQKWGRRQYFEARRGDRLITPDMQDDVLRACRYHGWTGSIIYDGEEEYWLW